MDCTLIVALIWFYVKCGRDISSFYTFCLFNFSESFWFGSFLFGRFQFDSLLPVWQPNLRSVNNRVNAVLLTVVFAVAIWWQLVCWCLVWLWPVCLCWDSGQLCQFFSPLFLSSSSAAKQEEEQLSPTVANALLTLLLLLISHLPSLVDSKLF